MGARKPGPPWLLGWGYLPLAVNASVGIVAVPALLAASHVPEAEIANVTSLFVATGFVAIPLTPFLDWRYSRRRYAMVFAVLCALANFATLLAIHDVVLLGGLLFIAGLCAALCINAVGGWFGSLVESGQKDALGSWFNVINFAVIGVMAALVMTALDALPPPYGAAAVSAPILLVLPLFALTPCPPADSKLASERFAAFSRDVASLFRRKDVQWILLIFIAPSASFALTNTLPGFGRDYHVSDQALGIIAGAGVSLAGVAGSLLVPPLTRRASPVVIYLLAGLIGASFTLTLIALPRDMTIFAIAVLGQNMFQGAAFTAANSITLRVIGHDNPLAATQFGVLIGVTQIPLTYMQMIDGHAYDHGGIGASFAVDALVSGGACVILALLYRRYGRRVAAI